MSAREVVREVDAVRTTYPPWRESPYWLGLRAAMKQAAADEDWLQGAEEMAAERDPILALYRARIEKLRRDGGVLGRDGGPLRPEGFRP